MSGATDQDGLVDEALRPLEKGTSGGDVEIGAEEGSRSQRGQSGGFTWHACTRYGDGGEYKGRRRDLGDEHDDISVLKKMVTKGTQQYRGNADNT